MYYTEEEDKLIIIFNIIFFFHLKNLELSEFCDDTGDLAVNELQIFSVLSSTGNMVSF